MEVNDFIQNFADQFDDLDSNVLIPETNFRELDEWSSMVALSVLAMIDDEYDVQLKAEEMRATTTVQQLFDLVLSKL
ncbi:acyl carrier protein [Butyricimonas faecihominis]|uniref:acyl carrier protein n=1 Tax=Butyricimonas faecihominis TaxID=1472416 RepID=UPI0032BF3C96